MKPRLLLVDDVDSVRDALAQMLAPRYEVTTARNSSQALELATHGRPFPVVVTDFAMPGEDGLELLERLRIEVPETVGILISGEAELQQSVASCANLQVFKLLTKPCSFEALAAAIEAALAHHTAREIAAADRERERFTRESLQGLNSILEERLERQTAILRRLNQLAVELNAAPSLRAIAALAAQAAFDLLGGRGVHVQLWSDADGAAAVSASAGPEMSACMLSVPVLHHAAELGELSVEARAHRGRELSHAQRSLLDSIAASVAAAAHNELRRRDRDRAQHALILALARLSEARDNETGRHLERVAGYSRLIAQALREGGRHTELIDDDWIEDLVHASPLHDIGKVGIPDSILLKPAKLTSREFEVMKHHAEIGASTLEAVMHDYGRHRLLEMGRDICWAHHERWDGSGYPRGLAGAAIPLAARILALADVYDALTSVRPYKHAWSHQEAADWIRTRGRGHFDPDVQAVFLSHEAEFDAIRARLADVAEAELAELLEPR